MCRGQQPTVMESAGPSQHGICRGSQVIHRSPHGHLGLDDLFGLLTTPQAGHLEDNRTGKGLYAISNWSSHSSRLFQSQSQELALSSDPVL